MASENKLKPTPDSVADFIAGVEHPVRRADALTLCQMMEEVSGEPAVLWSHSIIGFGRYHYRYDSGHEGVAGRIGFSPRKASLTIYIVPGSKIDRTSWPDLASAGQASRVST